MIRRAIVCAALTAALAAGAMPARAYTPHVLTFNYDEDDVSTLNPFLATAAPNGPLSELTSAEFVRFDPSGRAIPELVTSIPTKANRGISADGRTITWHLRHGLKWSDGKPLTAADVTYTFRVVNDGSNNIPSRTPWERLAAVTAPDPYTVVFRFKTPYSLFLTDYFSTLSQSCILPEHILGPGTQINQAAFNGMPVGAGPFRYTAFHREADVELEPNPYYWRGRPKLQRIVYKMITDENVAFTQLQTGELDLWDLVNGALAQRVKTLPGKAVASPPGNWVSGIYFNLRQPAVSDVRVRRALRLATDRNALAGKVALGNGLLQESLLPSVVHDYLALPLVPYDPKRAAALLDAAGWKRGADGKRSKNGVPLTIELAIPGGYSPSANAANLILEDWRAIGVGVNIHVWPDSTFFAPQAAGGIIQGGKFDAVLFSSSPGPLTADVTQFYTCAAIPPNGFNVDHYCNPQLDALNARYGSSFDPAVRARAAAALQRILDADVPGIVNYLRLFVCAYDNRLRGFHPSVFSAWGDPLQLDV